MKTRAIGFRSTLAVALLVAATVVHADYFVKWEIQDSTPFEFSYAKMAISGTAGSTFLLDQAGGLDRFYGDAESGLSKTLAETSGRFASEGGSDYSFQVYLYGEDDAMLAKSETKDFAALGDGGLRCINTSLSGLSGEGTWTVKGFTAVPEPTSGLLLLLGVAGLALRRRRV